MKTKQVLNKLKSPKPGFGKTLLLPAVFLLGFTTTKSQVIVTKNVPTNQLVEDVLWGSGVTFSNITFTGDSSAIGTFDGSLSNIGFVSGIIMSSGSIDSAGGPNINTNNYVGSWGTDFALPGDAELDFIANAYTYDASVLEFDFAPQGDSIEFNYVFASEEYLEYVNSGFNDVFGFFIDGPNPLGGNYVKENIARIPGTSTIVSIDNVNSTFNSSYYFDNGDGYGTGAAPDGLTVAYDGFTVPLQAKWPVVAGQTYHIKIVIADVSDGIYDSGVFLEASSLRSGSTTTGISEKGLSENNVNLSSTIVSDFIGIQFKEKYNGEIMIFDMRGDLVHSEKTNNESVFKMDCSALSQGMYILKIVDEKEKHSPITKKFIKR